MQCDRAALAAAGPHAGRVRAAHLPRLTHRAGPTQHTRPHQESPQTEAPIDRETETHKHKLTAGRPSSPRFEGIRQGFSLSGRSLMRFSFACLPVALMCACGVWRVVYRIHLSAAGWQDRKLGDNFRPLFMFVATDKAREMMGFCIRSDQMSEPGMASIHVVGAWCVCMCTYIRSIHRSKHPTCIWAMGRTVSLCRKHGVSKAGRQAERERESP